MINSNSSLEQLSAEELRALVRRNESTLDAVDAGVCVVDAQGRTVYVNEAGARLLGYSVRELMGQVQHAMIHHSYANRSPFPIEDCPIYGAYTDGVTQRIGGDSFWKRDGTPLPVDYVAIPIREARRLTGAVITFRDASEQVRLREQAAALAVEKAARENVERAAREVEQLADSIPQLAWMTDETGYINWYNQRWYDFTGTNLEDMKGWGWQKVHHPDYVDEVSKRFADAIARGVPWEDTFPLRGTDGEYRWFLSRARPMRDETGQIIRWFGTNTDVTEQRQAAAERDRALAEARATREQLLRIFEQAPVAIATTAGPDHRFVSTNERYRRLVSRRELIGRTVREVFPELADQGVADVMDRVYSSGEAYEGLGVAVQWNRDGTGVLTESVFDLVYQPLTNAEGQVEGLLIHAIETTVRS